MGVPELPFLHALERILHIAVITAMVRIAEKDGVFQFSALFQVVDEPVQAHVQIHDPRLMPLVLQVQVGQRPLFIPFTDGNGELFVDVSFAG